MILNKVKQSASAPWDWAGRQLRLIKGKDFGVLGKEKDSFFLAIILIVFGNCLIFIGCIFVNNALLLCVGRC